MRVLEWGRVPVHIKPGFQTLDSSTNHATSITATIMPTTRLVLLLVILPSTILTNPQDVPGFQSILYNEEFDPPMDRKLDVYYLLPAPRYERVVQLVGAHGVREARLVEDRRRVEHLLPLSAFWVSKQSINQSVKCSQNDILGVVG